MVLGGHHHGHKLSLSSRFALILSYRASLVFALVELALPFEYTANHDIMFQGGSNKALTDDESIDGPENETTVVEPEQGNGKGI